MDAPESRVPRDWLSEYLADHDTPCPQCGYNLRGLRSSACPECNERLVLAVRPAEPRLAWFVFGLVGLAGGAGFNVIVLSWALWVIVFQRYGPSLGEFWPVVIGAPMLAALSGLWVWQRRRMARWSASSRWWMAWGGWGLTILWAMLFFARVR